MQLKGCPCPNCKKKTMSHPDHAHAFGYKETTVVKCRKCGKRYKSDLYEKWLETIQVKEAGR
jgi:DNA-directed RNA polymerase subunit M/transcription elongation factor TFIIS